MITLLPARRTPRVLSLRRARGGLAVACIDPWDLRTATIVSSQRAADLELVIAALLTRERPTVVAFGSRDRSAVASLLRAEAERRGIDIGPIPDRSVVQAYASRLPVLFPMAGVDRLHSEVRQALATALAALHALPLRPPRHGHRAPHHRQ